MTGRRDARRRNQAHRAPFIDPRRVLAWVLLIVSALVAIALIWLAVVAVTILGTLR